MSSGILLSTSSDVYLKLDPRTKILLIILINIIIFSIVDDLYSIIASLIPLLLLATSKKIKDSIFFIILYFLSYFSSIFLIGMFHGIVTFIFTLILFTVFKLMPGLIMGYYIISTTTVSEFIASMEKIKVPKEIIVTLSVIFRFFPTLIEEIRSIFDAMKMRNILFNFKKPFKTIEFSLIPLLMSSVRIGDELSVSSLTRGLGSPVKRTNICEVGLNIQDYFFIIFMIILVFVAFIY